jgi:hypothetical protein
MSLGFNRSLPGGDSVSTPIGEYARPDLTIECGKRDRFVSEHPIFAKWMIFRRNAMRAEMAAIDRLIFGDSKASLLRNLLCPATKSKAAPKSNRPVGSNSTHGMPNAAIRKSRFEASWAPEALRTSGWLRSSVCSCCCSRTGCQFQKARFRVVRFEFDPTRH